jgi:hypothetical protein
MGHHSAFICRLMNHASHPRGLWSLDELTSSDAHDLLATARALKQAKGHGLPLKGKHVAVLSEQRDGAAADVFTAAARGLGAQVTHIHPSASRLTEAGGMQQTARILGRLYDAIECEGMAQTSMFELMRAAAVPVFNVLAQTCHPTRLLGDLMTMQEISGGPCCEMTLCVLGDERAPWSVAWRQMGGVTGMAVVAGAAAVAGAVPMPAGPAARTARPIGFVCDPDGDRCADGQPALTVLGRDGPNAVSLARQQMTNHRFIVQALLTHTIN